MVQLQQQRNSAAGLDRQIGRAECELRLCIHLLLCYGSVEANLSGQGKEFGMCTSSHACDCKLESCSPVQAALVSVAGTGIHAKFGCTSGTLSGTSGEVTVVTESMNWTEACSGYGSQSRQLSANNHGRTSAIAAAPACEETVPSVLTGAESSCKSTRPLSMGWA